jgi:hypothetical protein
MVTIKRTQIIVIGALVFGFLVGWREFKSTKGPKFPVGQTNELNEVDAGTELVKDLSTPKERDLRPKATNLFERTEGKQGEVPSRKPNTPISSDTMPYVIESSKVPSVLKRIRDPDLSKRSLAMRDFRSLHMSGDLSENEFAEAVKDLTDQALGTNQIEAYLALKTFGLMSDRPDVALPVLIQAAASDDKLIRDYSESGVRRIARKGGAGIMDQLRSFAQDSAHPKIANIADKLLQELSTNKP